MAKESSDAPNSDAAPSRNNAGGQHWASSPEFDRAATALGGTLSAADSLVSVPASYVPEEGSSSSASGPIVRGLPSLQDPSAGFVGAAESLRMRSDEQLILDLADLNLRENALAELTTRIGWSQDLGRLIWYSFGTIAILLQEVISIYPFLSLPSLTLGPCNKGCNALALLQCVASHEETRALFAKACIPCYLFGLLDQIGNSAPLERVRCSALGVIAALLQVPDTRVVVFLLVLGVLPPCLHAMQRGGKRSGPFATMILKSILLDNAGRQYICCNPELLYTVNQALENVVTSFSTQHSRDTLRCYLCLLEDERGLLALRKSLPRSLIDGMFDQYICDDQISRMWLQHILDRVGVPRGGQTDCHSNSWGYIQDFFRLKLPKPTSVEGNYITAH